jgi:mannose-1-phosphate guanylyltransferase
MASPRIHPVILAGGSGTRFWPLSRSKKPKQLLPLATPQPLIRDTYERAARLAAPGDILVVCGRAHVRAIRRLLPELPPGNMLVEPAARNTAPAIGLAAVVVAAKDPAGILAVLPSDHAVTKPAEFVAAVETAAAAAATGALVSIGVTPSRPETGYGYLKVGGAYGKEPRARECLAFVEKPDRARAEAYLASGDHLWNAGMFAFRADRLLEEIRKHLPACAEVLQAIAPTVGTRAFGRALGAHFPEAPSISIDYGVMEKASDLAVVPAEFGWSDLGSFASLPEVRPADDRGNVAVGDAVLVESRNNVVLGQESRIIALVGVEGLVVVDAGDAILVCPRERAQDVRKVVDRLKERGDDHLV